MQLEKEKNENKVTQQELDHTKKELQEVQKKLAFENYNETEKDVVDKFLFDNGDLQDILISFDELELEKQIGCGAFGEVILGWYSG